jgi:transposase
MDKDAYITQLETEIESLKQRLLDLERRLGLNSTNSSKPPATDGLARPARTKSTRNKGTKPSGGQTGHQGSRLETVLVPDHVIVHDVSICALCGLSLVEQAVVGTSKRQVFDIPEPKIEVTEHRALTRLCTCSYVNAAAFPTVATAPACYGARIQSFSTYLSNQHFIPEDRLQTVFKDLFDVSISTGSLATLMNAWPQEWLLCRCKF